MAMSEDGGPAFPTLEDVEFESGHHLDLKHPGMSLRDYFAGQAMQSLLTASTTNETAAATFLESGKQHGLDSRQMVAAAAYEMADAMLAERERTRAPR